MCIFCLCVLYSYFLSTQQTQTKQDNQLAKMQRSSMISFPVEENTNKVPVMMTTMQNRRNMSIRMHCFLCYSQTISSLILGGNQNGFNTKLFGKIMSKVFIMQDNSNKTTKCQKEHSKCSFQCCTPSYIRLKFFQATVPVDWGK